MSFRSYIQRLENQGKLVRVAQPVSKVYEIAGVLKRLEPGAVMFDQVLGTNFRVAGNLFCSKAAFAGSFGISPQAIIPMLARAIDKRTPCEVVDDAPCQEVVIHAPDLDQLPIPFHCQGDGGNYISSGVFLARHPAHGQNAFRMGPEPHQRSGGLEVGRGLRHRRRRCPWTDKMRYVQRPC